MEVMGAGKMHLHIPLVFVEICCLHNQNPTNRGGCVNASHRYLNLYQEDILS